MFLRHDHSLYPTRPPVCQAIGIREKNILQFICSARFRTGKHTTQTANVSQSVVSNNILSLVLDFFPDNAEFVKYGYLCFSHIPEELSFTKHMKYDFGKQEDILMPKNSCKDT